MEIQGIHCETDEIITDAYMKLRNFDQTKEVFYQIEKLLSSTIYESEKLIQIARKEKLLDLEEEYHRRRTLLKRIADGLAWEFLEYDTHLIKSCSIGNKTGFMFGKESFPYERNIVEALYKFENIRYAIQCDITNILHLSDVLALKTNGEIVPIEEKARASGKNSRAIRQRNRVESIISLLNNGESESVKVNGYPIKSIRSDFMFKHYWVELETLARTSLENGFSFKIFDDCVLILVAEQSKGSIEDYIHIFREVNWEGQKIIISSLGRHLHKNLIDIPNTCLPITIFPIEKEIGIKFILGYLDSVIAINQTNIVKKIQDSGLDIGFDNNSNVVVNMKGITFSIHEGVWSKLLNELVTVSSFIDYIHKSGTLIKSKFG